MQNAVNYAMLKYCGCAWLIFVVVWRIAALRTKPAVRNESLYSRLIVLLMMLLGAALLFAPWFHVGILGEPFLPLGPVSGYAGLALTVAGIAFAFWARFYLKGNWSSGVTVKQNHELIRTGPYAVVRHPIYTGILLGFLGTAIALGEIRGLVAVILATAALRAKSRIEESFMTDEFPDQYPSYSRSVKGIVPFVW